MTSLTEGPLLIPLGTKGMKIVKEVQADILLAQMRSWGTPEMNSSVRSSDNRARINESEFEEGREVGGPVSARTRAKGPKPDSRLVSGERSQQSARHAQKQHFTEVDAPKVVDATLWS